MSELNCPACQTVMETVTEPDVQIDVCPNCGGRFLDRGELNALATGMAGDIECCSIDEEAHQDMFPLRACPRCPDKKMSKINLLAFSDIIFDYCPDCGGFFLDRGETERMNVDLAELAGAPVGEEFRRTIDGHLVRANKIRAVYTYSTLMMGTLAAKPVESLQLAVYLKTPLGLGLRIFKEAWRAKLAMVFHLYKGQDIQTGDKDFDDAFIVQGEDERAIIEQVLSDEFRQALLSFNSRRPRIFSQPGSLSVFDDRIEYREGPYPVGKASMPEKDVSGVVKELIALAVLLEGSHAGA